VSRAVFPPSTVIRAVAVAAMATVLAGLGDAPHRSDWPLANHDLASSRSDKGSGIDRRNVGGLHVAWRFRFRGPPGDSGAFTATPVVAGGVVYVQDMRSNVFALDLKTGRIRWRRLFDAANPGPDGVAVQGGRVYGATDSSAFALDAATGRPLWRHFLVTPQARYVDMAPQVADGLVYVSTLGYPPDGRGVLYGLDARTGRVRWRRDTIKGSWHVPAEAGGGGAWQTPSVAGSDIFWGTANPLPYGGSRRHPNGGAYEGAALYTDSLLDLDARTGALRWYDQVTPHDVRDYDFQLPPILGTAAVFGAGKAGTVIAWSRRTHRRLWQSEVGIHRNDRGPLPSRPVSVCPGLYGGVLTPMAYGAGRLYVPVVDLCMLGSAVGYEDLGKVDVGARGRGEIVAIDAATGEHVWTRRFPEPDFGCATLADGVVFTSTFVGSVYALDTRNGTVLWRASTRAGINSCPALASHTLLVGAGVPQGAHSVLELTAYTTR
jgi:outer membrane protein assembly factor BamB